MSRKNYNVVLNSTFCTTDTAANLNNDKNYYIDWSAILPDKNFKLTFSFISETNKIQTMTNIPIITIDFLNQGKQIASQQSLTSYQATSSNILGLIFPQTVDINAHLAYLRSDKNFNNPIYLLRPRQNNFNVKIINNLNPPSVWTDDNTIPLSIASYVLILSFEECE